MKKNITLAYILRKQNKNGAHAFSKAKVREAAKELGHLGGLAGGPARAEALSEDRRREIAIHAICARWRIPCTCGNC